MADTNPATTASPGNEINFWGRLTAGILLIALTGAAIVTLIAFWPNKTPDFRTGDDGAWYTCKLFHMTLIESHTSDSTMNLAKDDLNSREDSLKNADVLKLDSATKARLNSTPGPSGTPALQSDEKCGSDCGGKRIHLNTILLLLVALMGFLGNMIHIASSFTSYVGNNTFKRSWILWYFVKPFTAAGLAVIVYFIIRAGFLSYGTGAAGISLYGILSLSALAGLFTDSATLKLKEVFEVIFKTKDDRKDKLNEDNTANKSSIVSDLSPLSIPAAAETAITVTGTNLDQTGIKVTMGGIDVTASATITSTSIIISYTPTAIDAETGKVELQILDQAGSVLNKTSITITA